MIDIERMSGSESDNNAEQIHEKRLFVGGLFPEVNNDELKSRFGRFGTVKGTEIKIRKDSNGNPIKTFAYIDLEATDRDFKKCVNTYNKTRWKGSELKIQVAKEDFMKKLKKEREETLEDVKVKETPDAPVSGIQSKLMAISDIATAANFNMKGAVPGTAIPGEEKWVVGKYGRVLPIVQMKRTGASKILKIDPSKLTHNLRRIKDEKYVDNVNPCKLTWQLEEYDNEISKKRKGEFPEWTPKVKKKRNVNGEFNNDNIQQRIHDVVERDKTYRNSDFEVVSLKQKPGAEPVVVKPKDSFNDVASIDSDAEMNKMDLVESFSNNIVNGFMDLSRFNSDSEEEMSKDAFRKAGLGQLKQNQNKSLEKIHEQKVSIQVKPNTSLKNQQLTRTVLEISPKPKQNDIRTLSSQNLVDEYSNGLNDESKSGKDKIVESNDESDGYESDDESNVVDDDVVDDDSDFENLVQREMKNLNSAKPESTILSSQQSSHNTISENQNISERTNLKPKIVEGKKTLLAFRGTKFLTSDSNKKTDLKGSKEVSNSVKAKVKGQLKGKKQTTEINFEKSTLKRAGLKNLINPKFLYNEFASGLDMVENSKVNASSDDDDDDDDSDFETFAKNEMTKIEAGKKQFSLVDNSSLGQSNLDEGNVGYFRIGKAEENMKVYNSSSDSSDSEKHTEISSVSKQTNDTVINSHKNRDLDCNDKPVPKISQNRKKEKVDDYSDDDDDDDVDDDDDDDDDDSDGDYDDDISVSSSDFETLISKAVKEVHGVKHSDVTSNDFSNVSKATENVTKSINKNELAETEVEDSCSTESESTEESEDEDLDNEMNDNSDKFLEHSNNASEILKTNHNRNLDADSLLVDVDKDDERSNDSNDDSDDESSSNVDVEADNGYINNLSHKGKKNQTLDYSGLMSESSDSDNDTLVETEPDSSDDSSCSVEGNMSVVNKNDHLPENMNDSKILKQHVSIKAGGIGDNGKNGNSDSCSGSEDDRSDTKSDNDTKMTQDEKRGINRTKQNLNSVKTGMKQTLLPKRPTTSMDSVDQNDRVTDKVAINVSSPMERTINQQDSTLNASTFQKNIKTSFDCPSPVKMSNIKESKSQVKHPQEENKADVDKKRLAAVKQRQKEALAQKSLIKNALSNLDVSKTVNTKIKFDSDSEEDQVAMETDEQIPAVKSQNQDKNMSMESKIEAKSKNLFHSDDDSDDDDDGGDDTNRFNIREEFEGAEGRKLAKLQSRFGNDERFRLDARFIESGSEEDADDKIVEDDETTRSLKILQSVVGIKAVSGINKQDKAKKKFKDVGALKYDPTCEEHKQFEVETEPTKTVEQPKPVEKKKKKKGKKREEITMETEPAVILPEVTKDKFYEISDSLKNTFVQKANTPSVAPSSGGGFSLLAAFGTHQSNDNDGDQGDMTKDIQDSIIPIPDVLRTNQLSLANRFNVRDDVDHEKSDEDDRREKDSQDQGEKVEKMDTTEQITKQDPVCTKPQNFFFLPNDERLKESINKKKESFSQDDWAAKRRHLIESYKSKHKNLRRKKGPMKKRGGKR